MAGVAAAVSGQLFPLFLAGVFWLILRHFRSDTPSEILFVVAYILGAIPFILIGLFSGYVSPFAIIEPLVVAGFALLLYLTRSSLWACGIIAHSSYIILTRAYNLYAGTYDSQFQRFMLGAIALQVIVVWMMVAYLRRALRPNSTIQEGEDEKDLVTEPLRD